jgi:hypothetical protein
MTPDHAQIGGLSGATGGACGKHDKDKSGCEARKPEELAQKQAAARLRL